MLETIREFAIESLGRMAHPCLGAPRRSLRTPRPVPKTYPQMTPGQQPRPRLKQNVVSIHSSETWVELHRRHDDGRIGRSLFLASAARSQRVRPGALGCAEVRSRRPGFVPREPRSRRPRGIAFSVEGTIYDDGMIPTGARFDPASARPMGSWVCRGWLILWPGRPALNAITTPGVVTSACSTARRAVGRATDHVVNPALGAGRVDSRTSRVICSRSDDCPVQKGAAALRAGGVRP
jgi:hypothetical protein